MEQIFILFWTFCAIMAMTVAQAKGRSRLGWFIVGVLFGPVAFNVALLPPLKKSEMDMPAGVQSGLVAERNKEIS